MHVKYVLHEYASLSFFLLIFKLCPANILGSLDRAQPPNYGPRGKVKGLKTKSVIKSFCCTEKSTRNHTCGQTQSLLRLNFIRAKVIEKSASSQNCVLFQAGPPDAAAMEEVPACQQQQQQQPLPHPPAAAAAAVAAQGPEGAGSRK